ncbi:TniQ family protein [Marinicella sp. S1101]|uniref:TniQ family protein n=1 Tax=Marinicella marina TaxID=2996016 RepID=UPI002260D55E|nr:TniQ family protein [Marinicella marina]MCX7553080.1 TniQ family protein [Marinicella marina]
MIELSKWPIKVDIQDDELFSSWLIRVALEHGISPIDITGSLWEHKRVWTTDIDRKLSSSSIDMLVKKSGISQVKLVGSTYSESIIHRNVDEYRTWPWLIPYGVRNRNYRGGLQFCPLCLKEDKKPYFRKSWRLSWNVSCQKHNSYLLELCPSCGSVVEPNKLSEKHGKISICASCHTDLSSLAPETCQRDCSKIQSICNDAYANKFITHKGQNYCFEDWFELLRFYALLISRCSNTKLKKLPLLLDGYGVQYKNSNLSGLAFEYLSVNERSLILSGCWKLMGLSDSELTQTINTIGISKNTFKGVKSKIPILFMPIYRNIKAMNSKSLGSKNKSGKPIEKAVVLRKLQRLLRKHRLKNSG